MAEEVADITFTVSLTPEFEAKKELKEGEEAPHDLQHKFIVSFPEESEETVEASSLQDATDPWTKTFERKQDTKLVLTLESAPVISIKIEGQPAGEENSKTLHTLTLNICSFLMNRTKIQTSTQAYLDLGYPLKGLKAVVSVDKPVMTEAMAEKFLPVELTLASIDDLPPKSANVKPVRAKYSFYGFHDVETSARSHVCELEWNPDSDHGTRRTFLLNGSKIHLGEFVARVEEYPLQVEIHNQDPEDPPPTESAQEARDDNKEEKEAGGEEKEKENNEEEDVPVSAAWRPELTRARHLFGVARINIKDLFKGSTFLEYSTDVHPEFPAIIDEPIHPDAPGPLLGRYTQSGGSSKLANPYHGMDADGMLLQTQVNLSLMALHPLDKSCYKLRHPFARAVFVLHYDDVRTLRKLFTIIREANAKALSLPDNRPRTLLLRALKGTEASDPTIDVITSVQLVDDQYRYLLVEGLSSGGQVQNEKKAEEETALEEGKEKEAAETKGDSKEEEKDVKVDQEVEDPPMTALEQLYAAAPLLDEGGPVGVLFNPTVSFRHRLYGAFQLVPKTIRLTKTLKRLQKEQSNFSSTNARVEYAKCLTRLVRLKENFKHGLHKAKEEDMFPSVSELLAFEKKFGKEVLDQDLGVPPKALPSSVTASTRTTRPHTSIPASKQDRKLKNQTEKDLTATGRGSRRNLESRRSVRERRAKPWSEATPELKKPAIDVKIVDEGVAGALDELYPSLIKQSSQALAAFRDHGNRDSSTINKDGFLKTLKQLDGVSLDNEQAARIFDACAGKEGDSLDFYALRKTVIAARERKEEEDRRRAKNYKREVDEDHDESMPVYMYSGQTLNYKTEQLRRMLNKDNQNSMHASYAEGFLTQSADFTNIDDDRIAATMKEIAARTHPKGFQHNVPRDPKAFTLPPKMLHKSQAEELAVTRWHEDKHNKEQMKLRHRICPRCGTKTLIDRVKCKGCRVGFSALGRVSKSGVFGYKEQKHVFHPTVHEADIEAVMHAKEVEAKKEWRTKLKGNPAFMAYLRGNSKKRPSQLDKNETILKDQPNRKSLMKTHVPHMPHNVFKDEPVYPEEGRKGYAKIQARPMEEKRAAFDRNLRRAQTNKPDRVHKRSAKPIHAGERTGARWGK